jgi:hypothetical protein
MSTEKNQNNHLALVYAEDLSLVSDNSLNQNQLQQILKRTPEQYIKKRPAKGGGQWDYVTGGYVKKCLNIMFGWDWDFEIVEQLVQHGEAIVKGRLTCRTNGKAIVKMQFGNKDIVFKKQSQEEQQKGLERIPLSIGNDLKAAATDCLKKCAAEIGIAADIYNKEDFNEVKIDVNNEIEATLIDLYESKKDQLPEEEQVNFERIIKEKEKKSYKKAIKFLTQLP